jgi:hypothetical protein
MKKRKEDFAHMPDFTLWNLARTGQKVNSFREKPFVFQVYLFYHKK